MHNSFSSGFDIDSNNAELLKRPQHQQTQLPKLLQLPSDIKPPTINSPIINCPSPFTEPLRSFISYRESGFSQFDQCRKAKTLNENSEGNDAKNFDEPGKPKKSQFNQAMRSPHKQPLYSELNQTESVSRNLFDKKYVKQFAQALLQKAYIYRDNYFNGYQKQLLIENYLENNLHYTIQDEKNNNQIHPIYFLFSDMIVIICIIILGIWLPYKISFNQEVNLGFEVLAILIIVLDLGLNYFKPYISEGNFVKFHIKYQLQFIKRQTFIDILYLVTTILLVFLSANSILIWCILLFEIGCGVQKLNFLIFRVNDFLPFDIGYYKIFMIVLYVIHLCSCFWYFIGLEEQNSWIITMNIEDEDEWTKYCYAIYINTSLLLNIGQGLVHIKTNVELIYSTIAMFISCWLIAFIIKHTSFMLKRQYQNWNENIRQMELINNFLSKRGISLHMSARIRNYIRFLNQQDKNDDQMQVLMQQLSPAIKEELFLQMRIKALCNCRSLFKFQKNTLENLTQIMEYVKFNPNEFVIQKHKQDDNSLYIIDSGEISILDQNTQLAKLSAGDSFGEYSFFSGELRQASAKAKGFVSLYKIEQSKFVQLIQQNKIDHERYVFIKHSLLNQQFRVINMCCYSCRASDHLISGCPIWRYTPDLEKVFKQENYNQQSRSSYSRSMPKKERKEFNRIFLRLIQNYDALKIFRLKYDIIYDDEDEEEDESQEDELESCSELSDDYQSDEGYSDNRLVDKQDGTIVSLLKQHDQIKEPSKVLQEIDDENDQMFIIRPNNQKGTLNTAQFQYQADFQQQQQQLYKFSLVPQEPQKIKRTQTPQDQSQPQQYVQTSTSSQLIASEVPIPSVKRIKNTPHITFKGDTDSQQSQQQSQRLRSNTKTRTHSNIADKIKKNLSRIREEDSDTLNLSNRQHSEEQASSPYGRQLGRQSQSSTQVRQSMKRFSSKLSTIPIRQGTITQLRSTVSPIIRSNIHIPTGVGMVDLSMYKRADPQSEEFERMYSYNLYYPIDNYQNVINRLNLFLKWRLSKFIPSKYTFTFDVKRIMEKINRTIKVELNQQ
ncbi:unnamed protein product (macronuclear) [Paramecium tetraurelia]|uniref:Cyclic nucleotide-binding domain-containing protein n=1 Tax=Paramecium tetraurelia TaxID=5888 RepID=A0BRS5_PARTE|nr:uncharacterized protein GSPATT00031473001 [Paramecium tetraurelia]CAK61242.1 unnamed protein product [Paramecium tetraurelia]|eukprot:XP_001428640.1 hypothetical protein (macronuclear) [Paramecium tetraurelia strain d4-2]